MLAADTVLDGESLARVLRMGHSRVPVHRPGDRTDLLGVVLVKELVLLDPDDRVPSALDTCFLLDQTWAPWAVTEPCADHSNPTLQSVCRSIGHLELPLMAA
jgi:CBS domain containing-hemolysin-like protein